jgi:hypothetical protein
LSGEAKASNPTPSLEVSTRHTAGAMAAWKPCPRSVLYLFRERGAGVERASRVQAAPARRPHRSSSAKSRWWKAARGSGVASDAWADSRAPATSASISAPPGDPSVDHQAGASTAAAYSQLQV